ncbi:MAG: glycosyltransferase [Schwartzia sp.]|nr:glycosyltransferase [Schwartzia sp. (in: firmicutes)]
MKVISVVLPCYRESAPIFEEALASVLQQTYRDIETIVIVDGPNPVLEKMLADYKTKDERLRFYVNEVNRGLPFSLNRGISLAAGKYIARMDADDISLPDRLEKQLRYLEDNNLEMIGAYCETISETGEHRGFLYGPVSTDEIYQTLPREDCMWHPTWLLCKTVWERVGGYADFKGCEDYHFLLKARKCGIRLGNLPEVCLKYRESQGSLWRSHSARTELTIEYFKMHCENIFNVTPDSMREYFESKKGARRLHDLEAYLTCRKKIQTSPYGGLLYGIQMLRLPCLRASLRRKKARWERKWKALRSAFGSEA